MREWPVAIEFERLSGNVFPESLFCAGAVEEGRGCWVFSAARRAAFFPAGPSDVVLVVFLCRQASKTPCGRARPGVLPGLFLPVFLARMAPTECRTAPPARRKGSSSLLPTGTRARLLE